MSRSQQILVIVLTLILCAVVVMFRVFSGPKVPSTGEWREILRIHALPYIPKNVLSCGEVAIGESAADAQLCVKSAIEANREFWVLAEGQGEDSHVWILIIGAKGRTFSSVHFDSIGWQSLGRPSFSGERAPCPDIRFGPANPIDRTEYPEPLIACSRA